ncbi:MAG: hypothetical protein P8080_06190 [Gammaproteobacteria bacterium]
MSKPDSTGNVDAAAAIEKVLAAEQAVREDMESCRREAQAILETAREKGRRITRRATGRISRLHARCDELSEQRIATIRAEALAQAPRTELNDADRETVTEAARRMAARLTRPEHG